MIDLSRKYQRPVAFCRGPLLLPLDKRAALIRFYIQNKRGDITTMKRCLPWLLILCLLIPMQAVAAQYAYVVNPEFGDRLHLRTEASNTATSLGRYMTGTLVEVLGTSGDYIKVKIANNTGYMMSEYLSDTYVPLELGKWAVVFPEGQREGITLRESEDGGSKAVGNTKRGDSVQVLGRSASGTHALVRTFGQDGYLPLAALQVDGEGMREIVLPVTNALVGPATNARAFPSRQAPVVAKLTQGPVKVLGSAGVWHYVERMIEPDVYARGFVLSSMLSPSNGQGIRTEADDLVVVVSRRDETTWATLREKPSTGAKALATLMNGAQGILSQESRDIANDPQQPSGDWWRITVNGVEGYVVSEYCTFVTPYVVE